jgi:ABC-type amino acid transport substrate-binding protein
MNPPGLHGTKVARAFEDRAALRGDMRSRLTVQTGPVVLTCGQADTLKKMKDSGAISLGVRESSGLSFTLGNGKYVGFHTEMAERVIADLQKQLGLAKLEIKYQPVTSQNRIPLVQNGTVDLECGSTTNNATRQKDVSFA